MTSLTPLPVGNTLIHFRQRVRVGLELVELHVLHITLQLCLHSDNLAVKTVNPGNWYHIKYEHGLILALRWGCGIWGPRYPSGSKPVV